MKIFAKKTILSILVLGIFLIGNGVQAFAVSLTDLTYSLEPNWIHITNNYTLKQYISTSSSAASGALNVAKKTKLVYYNRYDDYFGVTDNSVAIEILGHVYPDKLAAYLPSWLSSSIRNHTSVIDIGRSSVDSNRFIWDSIAYAISQPGLLSYSLSTSQNVQATDSKDTTKQAKISQQVDAAIKEAKTKNPKIKLDRDIMIKVAESIQNGTIDQDLLKLRQ